MGKRVKLSVIYEDNIYGVYGNIINNEPLTIEFENTGIFELYNVIIYSYIIDNQREVVLLDVVEIKENIVEFKTKGNISEEFYKNHYIEFSHIFSIKEIQNNEVEKYNKIASEINIHEINSTANKLKEVYSRDDIENREIISFLMDINAKLDEILYILKPKVNISGAEDYKSLMIGEEGIFFVSKIQLESEDIMIYTTIRDSGGFFSFAGICKVKEFIRYNNLIIYKALFNKLNTDTEEKIIKYIFRLEREMLKEANR